MRRFLRPKRIIIGLISFVVATPIVCVLLLYLTPPQTVVISPETTYVTGPLDEDGLPNYRKALNAALKPDGLTPETNAAVLLWKAYGPPPGHEEWSANYTKALGIESLDKDRPYFVSLSEIADKHADAEPAGQQGVLREKWDEQTDEQYDIAISRPWTREELPLIYEWVEANQDTASLVKEAVERPHFFSPFVQENPPSGPDTLENSENPLSSAGILGHLLTLHRARALLYAGEMKPDKAFDEALLVRNLSRISPFDVDTYGQVSLNLDFTLASHGVFNTRQLRFIQSDQTWILGSNKHNRLLERFMQLEYIIVASRGQISGFHEKQLAHFGLEDHADWRMRYFRFRYDVNHALRAVNRNLDKLEKAISRIENGDESAFTEFDSIWSSIDKLVEVDLDEWDSMADNSERLAAFANGFFTGAGFFWSFASTSRSDTFTRNKIFRLALTLEIFRQENEQYPKSLEELIPDYVQKTPADPGSNEPFRYRSDGENFLLYSVGTNGIDDGGKSYSEGGDDIVIESPGWSRSEKLEQEPAEQSNDPE